MVEEKSVRDIPIAGPREMEYGALNPEILASGKKGNEQVSRHSYHQYILKHTPGSPLSSAGKAIFHEFNYPPDFGRSGVHFVGAVFPCPKVPMPNQLPGSKPDLGDRQISG